MSASSRSAQTPRPHLRRQLEAALLLHHLCEEEVGDGHQDARAVACGGGAHKQAQAGVGRCTRAYRYMKRS